MNVFVCMCVHLIEILWVQVVVRSLLLRLTMYSTNFNQLYPVTSSFGAPIFFSLERAAAPYFGIKVCFMELWNLFSFGYNVVLRHS